MSWRDWSCEILTQNGIVIKWRCKHKNKDKTKTIETKLREKKIFPQENYEYNGNINGKKVSGSFTTGMGAMKVISAIDENIELSDAELAAGYAHIDYYC